MSCAEDGRAENMGVEKVQWGQHLVGLEQNSCKEQYLLKVIEWEKKDSQEVLPREPPSETVNDPVFTHCWITLTLIMFLKVQLVILANGSWRYSEIQYKDK